MWEKGYGSKAMLSERIYLFENLIRNLIRAAIAVALGSDTPTQLTQDADPQTRSVGVDSLCRSSFIVSSQVQLH